MFVALKTVRVQTVQQLELRGNVGSMLVWVVLEREGLVDVGGL